MIVVLTGPNDFARQAELYKLTSDFISKYGDIGLEKLDGEEADFQKVYGALTNLPFLAARKMVIIREPSADKEFAERAEALLKNLPETTDLILVEPKFDKRSSLYKLLKKLTDFREFGELDALGLTRWLVEQARARRGSLSAADANFLVSRAGTNQQLLKNELDKLLLYESKISRASIELLTEPTPQSTVFELLDAAFAGNSKKALKIYAEQRALKVEPLAILAMLVWQFHILAMIKTASARSGEEIAAEAKLNPYVVRKSLAIASRLSLAQIKKFIREMLTLDVRLKSQPIDADEALQKFLLDLGCDRA